MFIEISGMPAATGYKNPVDIITVICVLFLAGCGSSTPSGEVHINSPPVAIADTFSVAHGAAITRAAPGLMANDGDADGDSLTAILVSGVTHGELDFAHDGSFSYTPDSEFPGNDSFSYQISDGVVISDVVSVEITLPNIVLVLVDDMGQGDAPVYNEGSAIPMPNLTALANAGVRFDNAHATTATCSPTRYSLLTGNYPYRGRKAGGVWKTLDPQTMIIPGQQTLGHTLQAASYRTAFIGKLNNGAAVWNEDGTAYSPVFEEVDFARSFDRGPTQFGFDYSFLLPGGVGRGPYAYFENDRMVRYDTSAQEYRPFEVAAEARAHLSNVTSNQSFNGGRIGIGGLAMDNYDSRQVGAVLTNRAIAFVDKHLHDNNQQGANRPFFLYMAMPEAHAPWTPPSVFNAGIPTDSGIELSGTEIENATPISERTDVVYEADVILGTLIAKLDDEGLLNNTLIIFTSDNGVNSLLTQPGYAGVGTRIEAGPDGAVHLNAQGIVNGIPLRGYKQQIYEGGHKVPLVMRWGDGTDEGSVVRPGRSIRQMIGLHDLMATIADVTGVQLPQDQANDSYSYRQVLLQEESASVRDHMIIQGASTAQVPGMAGRAFYQLDEYDDLWKLIVDSDLEDPQLNQQIAALYNLSLDPGEVNNRLSDPTAATQLTDMLTEYRDLISLSRTSD
jgi:arylsulfatase A-like enzyme